MLLTSDKANLKRSYLVTNFWTAPLPKCTTMDVYFTKKIISIFPWFYISHGSALARRWLMQILAGQSVARFIETLELKTSNSMCFKLQLFIQCGDYHAIGHYPRSIREETHKWRQEKLVFFVLLNMARNLKMFARLFRIKWKPPKKFSRSCLQRRKIEKPRKQEFLTTWNA